MEARKHIRSPATQRADEWEWSSESDREHRGFKEHICAPNVSAPGSEPEQDSATYLEPLASLPASTADGCSSSSRLLLSFGQRVPGYEQVPKAAALLAHAGGNGRHLIWGVA